jgi:hypothetical protein
MLSLRRNRSVAKGYGEVGGPGFGALRPLHEWIHGGARRSAAHKLGPHCRIVQSAGTVPVMGP